MTIYDWEWITAGGRRMTIYDWEWITGAIERHGLRRPMADVGGYPFLSVSRYGPGPNVTLEGPGRPFDHIDPTYEIVSPDYGAVDLGLRATAEDAARRFPERYGTAVCSGVLEHARDPFACAAGLADLVRYGGLVLLATPFLWPVHGDPGTDFWRFTPAGLRLVAERVGLTVLEETWVYGDGSERGRAMGGVVCRKGTFLHLADVPPGPIRRPVMLPKA